MENTVSDPIRKEGNDNFFESFRTVSEQRPLSLFLGAGLDADAGFPGLLELLKPVAKDLKVSIDDKTDLFELAQFYEDKYNRNELLEKIKKRLQSSNRDSHLLSTVMQLNFRTIWTTNYDSMIEDYLKKQDTPFSKIYKPQQLNEIRENAINLIKINGDLDSYESIIITKKELQTHKIKHHLFFDFLTKELTTDTFLFVGYSFKDDLVLKNIAELREVLGEYAPIHYSIQKQVDPKKTFEFKMQQYELKSLKKNYGIETYLVENYEEIPKVINRIRDVQIKHNVFISASLWAPSNDEDNFSYRLTQALADKLIDNKFNIYNGLGKRIGGYLTGAAFQYLQQSHTPMITSRLRIEPFKVKDTESEKNEFRDSIISDFKIFIFMFGDAKSDQPVTKSGVYNEYLRAYKYYGTRAIYVPIPWTGYAAKAVFDNMCKSIDQFPYLRNMQKKFNDFPSASMMTSIVSGKDKTIDTWIDEVVDSTINALNSGVEYIDSFPLNQ